MVIRVERSMESAYRIMSCLEATVHISNWYRRGARGFRRIKRAGGDLTTQQSDRILYKRVLLKEASFIGILNDTGLICCNINVSLCRLKEEVQGREIPTYSWSDL